MYSVTAQKTETEFIHNCFNVDGGVLFCLKTIIQSCDNKWFYQILSPPDEFGTSYVVDTQMVLSGESSTQCYPVTHHEDQCQYCVGFLNSVVDADGNLRAALHVDLHCGESTVSYPHNILRAQGKKCAYPDYYYLPCDTQDNCVLIGETSELFCPTVLVDTCATPNIGVAGTVGGLSVVVPTGNPDAVCTGLSDGSFCVTADILTITDEVTDNFLTVSTIVQAEFTCNSLEDPCYFATGVIISARYPKCGFTLEDGCRIVEHDDPVVLTQSVNDQNNGDQDDGDQDDHHPNHPVVNYADSGTDIAVEEYEDSGSDLYFILILVGAITAVSLCMVLSAVGIFLIVRTRKPANNYQLVYY